LLLEDKSVDLCKGMKKAVTREFDWVDQATRFLFTKTFATQIISALQMFFY